MISKAEFAKLWTREDQVEFDAVNARIDKALHEGKRERIDLGEITLRHKIKNKINEEARAGGWIPRWQEGGNAVFLTLE